VILVDSNIPMYLIGAPHPHKADAQRLLEKLVSERQRLVTDAEVLQEILHRYVAIGRRDAIQPAFDVLLGIVDDVLSVEQATQCAPRRSYWAIPGCQPGTRCILPLWSNTKSSES
jgi:predicted nucleic acid-binding protein